MYFIWSVSEKEERISSPLTSAFTKLVMVDNVRHKGFTWVNRENKYWSEPWESMRRHFFQKRVKRQAAAQVIQVTDDLPREICGVSPWMEVWKKPLKTITAFHNASSTKHVPSIFICMFLLDPVYLNLMFSLFFSLSSLFISSKKYYDISFSLPYHAWT